MEELPVSQAIGKVKLEGHPLLSPFCELSKDRLFRNILSFVLPRPKAFLLMAWSSKIVKPFSFLFPKFILKNTYFLCFFCHKQGGIYILLLF